MPIYEFVCKNKHITEVFFKIYNLDTITSYIKENKCSICGEHLSWKKFSRVSEPKFKGTGFYKTDYKK